MAQRTQLYTPVAFLIFNRPEITERVHQLRLVDGESAMLNVNGIDLQAFFLNHGEGAVPNLGYMFDIGDVRLFHSGDTSAELIAQDYLQLYQLAEKEIDIKRYPKGTGPFVIVDINPTKFVKFERFDDYWQEGLPYLDSVEIRMVNDTMAGLMAFQAGEADALYFNGGTTAEELAAAGNTINARIFSLWSIGGDSLNDSCPWSDQNVREAVAHALDVEAMITGVYGDAMFPITQLAIEGRTAYNPDIVAYPYDVEKAKQLLADSPYNISKDNPWKVKFTYIVQAGDEAQIMTVIQSYLAEVGIELELNGVSFPAQKDLGLKGFKDQLILTDLSYNGVEMQYCTALTASFSEDAIDFGIHMYIPEEFNSLYRQMKVEADLAERELMYQELNRIAVDDFCLVVPFMGNEGFVAVAPHVHDYDFGNGTVGEFLPERAWMSE